MMRLSPNAFVIVMFIGQLSATWGLSTLPTVLEDVQTAWSLTNTQAGFLNGVFFFGFAVTTPFLTGLTDRVDPKRIYLWSMLLCGLAQIGFAYLADDFISGNVWRFLYGVGFAGTYMPGLKAVSDAVPAKMQSRAVATFTASMPTGTGLSFFLSGAVAQYFMWQDAIALLATGTLVAMAVVVLFMPTEAKISGGETGVGAGAFLPNVKPAFTNRRSLGHIVAYFAHQMETSTTRAFAVVFLIFAMHVAPGTGVGVGVFDWNPASVVGLATILGLPVILLADHLTNFIDRNLLIPIVMMSGAVLGIVLAVFLGAPYIVVSIVMVVYGVAASADGGLLNAGLVASADPQNRGGVMAAHSAIGFTGALLGPVIFGVALDWGGGQTSSTAWLAGFTAVGVIITLCAIVSRILIRQNNP